jgi:hypothetical protein
VLGLQPHFLVQFAEHGLFGRFAPINATCGNCQLWVRMRFPRTPGSLVEQDDADVRAKSVPVKHNQTQIFELCPLCTVL